MGRYSAGKPDVSGIRPGDVPRLRSSARHLRAARHDVLIVLGTIAAMIVVIGVARAVLGGGGAGDAGRPGHRAFAGAFGREPFTFISESIGDSSRFTGGHGFSLCSRVGSERTGSCREPGATAGKHRAVGVGRDCLGRRRPHCAGCPPDGRECPHNGGLVCQRRHTA